MHVEFAHVQVTRRFKSEKSPHHISDCYHKLTRFLNMHIENVENGGKKDSKTRNKHLSKVDLQ